MDIQSLKTRLTEIGQQQVLQFVDQLDSGRREILLGQISALDLPQISLLVNSHVRKSVATELPKEIQPAQTLPQEPDTARKSLYADAQKRGQEMLRAGKAAAFLVAGGQGTRLGYDGPKGEYPVTPIKKKPLFQVFAEQLLNHSRRWGKIVPWYIMTSEVNDAPTREFFHKNNFFGLHADSVIFFQQGMMPAFSMDGRMLLAEKSSLALSPDGHGGSLRALSKSGALDHMRRRGVEHLSYFQVDNPLVHVIDPLFLGLHELTGSEMSSKTIPKAAPLEKVGNFVIGDGKLQVIEYSDLPESLARQTNADGTPRFNSASIGIHILSVKFVERLNEGGRLNLPWHRAEKKVPFVDEHGQLVKPEKPNAIKLEQFVFDAIPLAKNAMVYTTTRAEEFSPVKNAEGVDSPQTCRRDQLRRAAIWLSDGGVPVPMKDGEPDATIEISPLRATCAEEIQSNPPKHQTISSGEVVYLE